MSDRKQNTGNLGEPDSEFDREHAMVSRAYRDSDAGSDGPPLAMDDAIRAAARRAAKSSPRIANKSWVSRWSAPLSAAALVVLTTSVGFLALDEKPELAPPLPREIFAPNEPSTSVAAAPQSAPLSPSPVVSQAPAALPPMPTKEKKALAEARSVAPRDQLAQVRKPEPERNRSEATVGAPRIEIAQESNRVASANSPVAAAPAAAAPVAKAATRFVADPVATGAIAANKDNAAPTAKLAKRESALENRATELPANAGATARADAAHVAEEVKVRTLVAAPPPAVATRYAASPASPPAAQPATAAVPSPASLADKAIESADAWMKRILELKKLGKSGELDVELAKFRKQYPNFRLPDELKSDK